MKAAISSFLLLAAAACNPEGGAQRLALSELDQKISIVPRGSTCAGLGLGGQQFTLTAPVDGDYAIDAHNTFKFRYYDDTNTIFYFTQSSIRMTGVIATIGERALAWDMPGGADGWPSLHGPPDADTGDIESPDEVAFCYDYELYIQPSPYANHARRATWAITKTGRTDFLTLSEGQTEVLEYDVTVRAGQPVADGQYIDGPVFVHNKSPHEITVSSVRTRVGTFDAVVLCPAATPFTMAPFSTMECSFKQEVPDTTDRQVVGSGTSSHNMKITTIPVVASFSSHNTGTTTYDRCIDVRDQAAPYNDNYLGTVCTEQGEETFSFEAEFGPYACGNFTITNKATYTGLDTGNTADASWTVNGTVACSPGCSLSAFYWIIHSEMGWRRYNNVWDQIGAQGENTPFFRSGQSYIHTMIRLSLGNPYWTLARAYIAAKLNKLNGAAFPAAVTTAFNNATNIFTTYSPSQTIFNLSLRKQIVRAAATLRDFNQGRTGPGRCTCNPDNDSDD
jgi:hypothetical protein